MAAEDNMWVVAGVNIALVLCCLMPVVASQNQYCSFFNNRAPKAQPGLKNCTWFKENSCCMQQEIEATFGNVKPLKGASLECQKYINYLMCYICAPNQNLFYRSEQLTVCEEFCNRWFDACRSATLKGSAIGQLHDSGRDFCRSRRFDVEDESCFTFDISLDTRSSSSSCMPQTVSVIAGICLCLVLQMLPMSLGINSIDDKDKLCAKVQPKRKRSRSKGVILKSLQMNSVKTQTGEKSSGLKVKHFRMDKPFSALILCFVLLPYSAGALNAEDVRAWAELLSVDLTEFAKKGLRYEEIQQLYENAEYETEYINGTAKILELKEKLGDYFSSKKELALQLADWVRQLHDTWWLNRDISYESSYYANQDKTYVTDGSEYGHQNFHGNDLSRSLHPEERHDEDEDSVMVQERPTLEDLSLDVYKDADLPHRLPPKLLQFNEDFGRVIMDGYSVVKIPDDLDRQSQETMDTVEWTARLDEAFIKNREADSDLRWQYFGSSTGVHRHFPGHEWPANFIGFKEDYDPRTRPWYVAATSGPKDIVLVLDGSASMADNGSMGRMKKIAINVLSTLTRYDTVNVVVSRSSFWDSDGNYHEYIAEALIDCPQTNLVPATPTHRKQLGLAIENLQPVGGSDHIEAFHLSFMLLKNSTKGDCQSLIIFITDGAPYDHDQRCTPGYHKFDDNNVKHYMEGELCEYDFDRVVHIVNVLQYQIPRKAHLFTFLTQDDGHRSELLPGQLACNNQGAMATVTENYEIFQQMAPYFRFLEASTGADEPIWTSPYLDKVGLGLMVTLAVPVFSNVSKKHLGVVGIDTPLSHLETLIHHTLWGTTYGFMIDSRDASTIIHPFAKPSAQLLDDPSFIPITSLEMDRGEPRDFADVLEAMQEQQTGDRIISEYARRAITVHNSLIWRPVEYAHYFYTDIPDSDYSIAYNLAQPDETFQYARDPVVNGPVSFLHEMDAYRQLNHPYTDFYNQLEPVDDDPAYPGLKISKLHSVVKLAPRCFCEPDVYLEMGQPSVQNIHDFINIFTPTYDMHCPRGTYRTDVRPDVKLTAQLESLWLQRDEEMQSQIVWTYMGTMSGVMRLYPGVEMNRDFDPTKRLWYHRSEANRGKLAISSVYLDNMPQIGKVITLSWAVHKAKPLTPPDCTGALRDYGCPCDFHHHCKSDYCYRRSCADDLIQGVVAMDQHYADFQRRIYDRIEESSSTEHCNTQTTCPDGQQCYIRCHLVDDMGNLVISHDFDDAPDHMRDQYEDISLASREGYIFGQLLQHNIFVRHARVDYQGVCTHSKDIPQLVPVDRFWTADTTPKYSMEPGPIPPFQNEYGCIQQKVYYTTNKTTLYNGSLFITGDMAHDPCSSGTFYFTVLPDTNLFLLVIKDHSQRQGPVNFNCHIQNRVYAPGSFTQHDTLCSAKSAINNQRLLSRSCQEPKRVPIPCGFSGAGHRTQQGMALLGCAAMVAILHATSPFFLQMALVATMSVVACHLLVVYVITAIKTVILSLSAIGSWYHSYLFISMHISQPVFLISLIGTVGILLVLVILSYVLPINTCLIFPVTPVICRCITRGSWSPTTFQMEQSLS